MMKATLRSLVSTLAVICLAFACGSDPPALTGNGDPNGDGADGGGRREEGGSPEGGASPDGSTTACAPNATLPCACATGVGVQRCFPDGSRWLACECLSYGAELAVSPTGDDAATGTLADPFRTPARAQAAVKDLVAAGLPANGLVVWLRGGSYPVTETLKLGPGDSGNENAGVTWSGYPGEAVHLVGGTVIDPGAFAPVTSASPVFGRLDPSVQGKVVVADLKVLGVTDYGTLAQSGNDCSSSRTASALELTIDGASMPLARWPDSDEDTDVAPDVNGTALHVYGTGLTPDVSGDYVKTGVADGVSQFSRTGLVAGKQYNLHRYTWTDSGVTHTAWFLTTTASGYPQSGSPFFFVYMPTLQDMSPANGASGTPSFRDPAAIHKGFVMTARGLSGGRFVYSNPRPSRWAQAPDAWLHGLFQYGWAECHTKVASIDTAAKTITVTPTPGYGIADLRPFYAENLLEEITAPGEYYVDRAAGLLYLLPPSSLTGARIVVSMLETPLVSLAKASHVTLRDMTLEDGRANLIEASDASHVRLIGLTLRNGGGAGANLRGTDIGVSYANVYGTATGGVLLTGGDRPSLTPGGDYVENSHIHDYARRDWMYSAGVDVKGVGNRVSHNKIHGAPHNAVLFFGTNDTKVEYNDIYGVCTDTADAGAIYSGRDWGARGDEVIGNYLHDLSSSLTDLFSSSISGIYLDDCLSGVAVRGNILDRIGGIGILHGGGRDVIMESNLIANCEETALSTDSRCVGWASGSVGELLNRLNANHYQDEPWRSRYPECAAIPNDLATIQANGWGLPQGSIFSRNAGVGNFRWLSSDEQAVPAFAEIKDDVPDATPLFVDEAAGDMNVQAGSPALAIPGFVPTPFSQIGIQP
jgi:hypothetical protein